MPTEGLTMRWSERRTALGPTFEMTSTLLLEALEAAEEDYRPGEGKKKQARRFERRATKTRGGGLQTADGG
jgi:hypothetical protein